MKSRNIGRNTEEITSKLTVSAIMVALSTVLSFIKFADLPYGGSVTLFSFVPILFVGYAYGMKWGIGAGLVHGTLQMVFGISSSIAGAGFKWWQVALCAVLDYLVAFALLGTGGMFKKTVKKPQVSFGLGAFAACMLKYLSHAASGFILFKGYAEWFFTDGAGAAYGGAVLEKFSGNALGLLYTFVYNGLFSVPEMIISIVMAVILISVKPIRKITGIK